MKKLLITLFALGLFISNVSLANAASSPKIYVQWAQSGIPDWSLLNSGTWNNQPTKVDPVGDTTSLTGIGDSLLNTQKGWVFAVNVQGVTFTYYDHYAIQENGTSVTVTAWRDDPLLFPVGSRQADVAVINSLKFDAKVGQDNTDQTFAFYREGNQYTGGVNQLPYANFVPPDSSTVKPGIFLSDDLYYQFIAAQTAKGWR